jgi:hypothetical protein
MPKYQVIHPIEKNGVVYVPQGSSTAKLTASAANGKPIAVDASGEIELTEEEASKLIHGQVPVFQGKPDYIGGADFRAQKGKDDTAAAAAKSAAEKAEYEAFMGFKAAKATKKK